MADMINAGLVQKKIICFRQSSRTHVRARIHTCTHAYTQFYFMDSAEDTEPRKFFCFDGCLVNLNGKELEVKTAELMDGSVPRATYKFMAEGECSVSLSSCLPCVHVTLNQAVGVATRRQ